MGQLVLPVLLLVLLRRAIFQKAAAHSLHLVVPLIARATCGEAVLEFFLGNGLSHVDEAAEHRPDVVGTVLVRTRTLEIPQTSVSVERKFEHSASTGEAKQELLHGWHVFWVEHDQRVELDVRVARSAARERDVVRIGQAREEIDSDQIRPLPFEILYRPR